MSSVGACLSPSTSTLLYAVDGHQDIERCGVPSLTDTDAVFIALANALRRQFPAEEHPRLANMVSICLPYSVSLENRPSGAPLSEILGGYPERLIMYHPHTVIAFSLDETCPIVLLDLDRMVGMRFTFDNEDGILCIEPSPPHITSVQSDPSSLLAATLTLKAPSSSDSPKLFLLTSESTPLDKIEVFKNLLSSRYPGTVIGVENPESLALKASCFAFREYQNLLKSMKNQSAVLYTHVAILDVTLALLCPDGSWSLACRRPPLIRRLTMVPLSKESVVEAPLILLPDGRGRVVVKVLLGGAKAIENNVLVKDVILEGSFSKPATTVPVRVTVKITQNIEEPSNCDLAIAVEEIGEGALLQAEAVVERYHDLVTRQELETILRMQEQAKES
ncbi:hypothetical protein HDU67_007460 [Dinochytrium kinnereticum]|nr:hypothetical protein HDU67_007460 [Dinochytrium kinnereticum]